MTYMEMVNTVMEIAEVRENIDLMNTLGRLRESLESKKVSKANSKKVKANEAIKEVILNTLEEVGEPIRIMDLAPLISEKMGENLSINKVSALMTQLKDADLVERHEKKRVATFTIK